MAENQYNKRIAERVDDYADDDPLAELARVVGYDPRRGEGPDDLRQYDFGMELEAELLRELDEPEAAYRAGPAEARERERQYPREAAVEELRSDGADEQPFDHARLSDEIGLSLEDELMRELQDEYEDYGRPEEAPAETVGEHPALVGEASGGDVAPEEVPETAAFAIIPELIVRIHPEPVSEAEVAPEPETGEADDEPVALLQPETAGAETADEAETEDEAGGFAFPAEDELEQDEQFAANQWNWEPLAAEEQPEAGGLSDLAGAPAAEQVPAALSPDDPRLDAVEAPQEDEPVSGFADAPVPPVEGEAADESLDPAAEAEDRLDVEGAEDAAEDVAAWADEESLASPEAVGELAYEDDEAEALARFVRTSRETDQPADEAVEPEAAAPAHDVPVGEPEAEPEATAWTPDVPEAEAEAAAWTPDVWGAEPEAPGPAHDTTEAEAEAAAWTPDVWGAEPEAAGPAHDTTEAEAEAAAWTPDVWGAEPEAAGPAHDTTEAEAEAAAWTPDVWGAEPEAAGPAHDTHEAQPAAPAFDDEPQVSGFGAVEDEQFSGGPVAEEAEPAAGMADGESFPFTLSDASWISSVESRASSIVQLDRYEAGDADMRPGRGMVEEAGATHAVGPADDADAAMFDSSAMEAALAAELARPDEVPPSERPQPAEAESARAPGHEGAAANPAADADEDLQESAQPVPRPEPSALESAAAAMAAGSTGSTEAFDPAALSEHDEKVEPTFELDLPRLPGDEEGPAPAPSDDFQMDLDAEIINLFKVGETEARPAGAEEPSGDVERGIPAAAGMPAAGGAAGTQAAATARFEPVAAAATSFDDLGMEFDERFGGGFTSSEAMQRNDDVAEVVIGPPQASPQAPRWQKVGAGVAAIVLVGVVAVLGWEFTRPGGDSGEAGGGPRIIAASKQPVKQKPAEPGGKTVPNQNKVVYDKVDGSKSEAPQQKALISSAETPLDVVQRTLHPDLPSDPAAASGEPDGMAGVAAGTSSETGQPAAAGKGQARLAPDRAAASATPASDAPAGIVPHYVQTMTVTADGKLVPSAPADEPASTGSDQVSIPAPRTPAADRQAPAAPGQPAKTADLKDGSLAVAPAPLPVARPKPAPAPAPAQQTAPKAPAPGAQVRQPAQTQPPATANPPAAQTASASAPAPSASPPAIKPGEYMIQIASQPTEAGAQASYRNLAKRYGSVIGGKAYDIQKAEIVGKGTYYRVRIAAGSRQDAITLCQNYKAAGGSCYVTH